MLYSPIFSQYIPYITKPRKKMNVERQGASCLRQK